MIKDALSALRPAAPGVSPRRSGPRKEEVNELGYVVLQVSRTPPQKLELYGTFGVHTPTCQACQGFRQVLEGIGTVSHMPEGIHRRIDVTGIAIIDKCKPGQWLCWQALVAISTGGVGCSSLGCINYL